VNRRKPRTLPKDPAAHYRRVTDTALVGQFEIFMKSSSDQEKRFVMEMFTRSMKHTEALSRSFHRPRPSSWPTNWWSLTGFISESSKPPLRLRRRSLLSTNGGPPRETRTRVANGDCRTPGCHHIHVGPPHPHEPPNPACDRPECQGCIVYLPPA
jgi:hypothetical protein